MGPLRALVNSAGIGYAGRTIDRNNQPFDLNAFEFVIRVNLIGSFNMLTRSAAAMAQTDPVDDDGSRGAIVNMASAAARRPDRTVRLLGLEGGVVGMTLPIARDLSAVGIRQPIAPGDRHPDLRRGRAERSVQGAPRPVGAVPEASRLRRGARLHRDGVHHQSVSQRRDHPARRWHPDATEVGECT